MRSRSREQSRRGFLLTRRRRYPPPVGGAPFQEVIDLAVTQTRCERPQTPLSPFTASTASSRMLLIQLSYAQLNQPGSAMAANPPAPPLVPPQTISGASALRDISRAMRDSRQRGARFPAKAAPYKLREPHPIQVLCGSPFRKSATIRKRPARRGAFELFHKSVNKQRLMPI